MKFHPIRLTPGQDLREGIEQAVRSQGVTAAFVVCGIGSLSHARLRMADASQFVELSEPTEIVGLSGSVAANGLHLHGVLSTATGAVIGGHVAPGCLIRTTAEILLALLPEWDLSRSPDASTGYDELVIRPRDEADTAGAKPA